MSRKAFFGSNGNVARSNNRPVWSPRVTADTARPAESFQDRCLRLVDLPPSAAKYFFLKAAKLEGMKDLTRFNHHPENMLGLDADDALTAPQKDIVRSLDGAFYSMDRTAEVVFPGVNALRSVYGDQLSVADPATERFFPVFGGMSLRVRLWNDRILYATDKWIGTFDSIWRVEVNESLRLNTLIIETSGIIANALKMADHADEFLAKSGRFVAVFANNLNCVEMITDELKRAKTLIASVDSVFVQVLSDVTHLRRLINRLIAQPEAARAAKLAAKEGCVTGAPESEVSMVRRIVDFSKSIAMQVGFYRSVIDDIHGLGLTDIASNDSCALDCEYQAARGVFDGVVDALDNGNCLINGDLFGGQWVGTSDVCHVFQIVSGRKCPTNRFWDEFILYSRSVYFGQSSHSSPLDKYFPLLSLDQPLSVVGPTVMRGIYNHPSCSAEVAQRILSVGYTSDAAEYASPLSNGEAVLSLNFKTQYESVSRTWRRLVTNNNTSDIKSLLPKIWTQIRTTTLPTRDEEVDFGAMIGCPRGIWDTFPVRLMNEYITRRRIAAPLVKSGEMKPIDMPMGGLAEFHAAIGGQLASTAASFAHSANIFTWVACLVGQAVSFHYYDRIAFEASRIPVVCDPFYKLIEDRKLMDDLVTPEKSARLESDLVALITPPGATDKQRAAVVEIAKRAIFRGVAVASKILFADDLARDSALFAKIVEAVVM